MVDKTTTPYTDNAYGHFLEESDQTTDYWSKVEAGEILPVHTYKFVRTDGELPQSMTYNGLRNEQQAGGFQSAEAIMTSGIFNALHDDPQKCGTSQERMEDIVENKLLSRARSTKLDLGVTIGEFYETSNFISDTFVKIARSYKALRKGNLSEALKYVRTRSRNQGNTFSVTGRELFDVPKGTPTIIDIAHSSADTWLTLQLAVKPLIKDVTQAIEFLEDGLKKPNFEFTIRASERTTYSGKSSVHIDNGIASVKDYNSFFNGTGNVSGKLIVVIDDVIFSTLEQAGLNNPFLVAWELVPLSFLVDYVLPVGDFIANVFPPSGVKVVDGYTYYKAGGFYKSSTDIGLRATPPGWHTSGNERVSIKHRKKLGHFPQWNLIVPDLSLSKSQVATATSILWNMVTKRS